MNLRILAPALLSLGLTPFAQAENKRIGSGDALPSGTILCHNFEKDALFVDIYPDKSKTSTSVKILNKGVEKIFSGTFQETQEYRYPCPSHPASCGGDMIPIDVIQVLLEEGSQVYVEFPTHSAEGTGNIKNANQDTSLTCSRIQ